MLVATLLMTTAAVYIWKSRGDVNWEELFWTLLIEFLISFPFALLELLL